ncbi:hypothetical protein [Alishewanella sp. HL-SH06]|uniref:hypothetical protein n=1 Tax=Alishewanella sp. HL-SH06 TaxID=3461144 RepID=UPI0040434FC4
MRKLIDPVILLVCLLLILVGYIFGISSGLIIDLKITDLLTSIGTIGAVVVALWAVDENHRRDTYKLTVTGKVNEKPKSISLQGMQMSESVSNIPKVTIRVVNVGRRPITLESVCIRSPNKGYEYENILVRENDKSKKVTLQPGEFFTRDLQSDKAGKSLDEIYKNEFFIVDALEYHHKAKLNGNYYTIKFKSPDSH